MARGGKRIRTVHLEVRAVASPLGRCRVGIVVPKHKHTSVERNRLKRRLRELVRLTLLPGAPAADVLIRTRKEAYGATFELLARDVERARRELDRLGVSGVGRRASSIDDATPADTNKPPTA